MAQAIELWQWTEVYCAMQRKAALEKEQSVHLDSPDALPSLSFNPFIVPVPDAESIQSVKDAWFAKELRKREDKFAETSNIK